MFGNFKVITICGSTRYKDQILALQRDLTLAGNIVMTSGVFSHADNIEISDETIKMLTEMHHEKMLHSDLIVIADFDGYIGQGLREEIVFAQDHNLVISILGSIEEGTFVVSE